MSFSSGTFSLVAGNPVVTGTTISSTWANNTLSDIATGLTTCVLKDGTQATTASVPFVFGIAVTTAMTTPSTTFALVNTTVTTLNFAGAATTLNVGAAASDTTWTGQSFTLTGANSTDNTVLAVTNTSNAAAASHAYLDVSVGGTTSTGDPHTRWTIPSGTSWYAGADNSDSDSWKLGTGTAVGTNTLVTVTSAGAMTVADDLAVNGDSITTDDTTFNLINATATTVNFAQGASTALNVGHASGTNTVAGATTFSQALTAASLSTTTPLNSITAGVAQYKSGTWTPAATNLTTVGSPTFEGSYSRIGNRVEVTLIITPGTSTASTAGSTYFTGLPYDAATSTTDAAGSVGDAAAVSLGTCILYGASPVRLYTPTWGANGNAIAVSITYRTNDAF